MKTPLLLLLGFCIQAIGQNLSTGSFINLNFESPNLSHAQALSDALRAPTTEVLNGWNWSGPNFTYISETAVSPITLLSGSLSSHFVHLDYGRYSLFVGELSPVSVPDVHLSQIGTIPDNAMGLQFFLLPGVRFPEMLIDDKFIKFTSDRFSGISYANVSEFAGRKVKLEFIIPVSGGGTFFDIGGFVTIPEPSTYALLGLGAAILWWQRSRQGNG